MLNTARFTHGHLGSSSGHCLKRICPLLQRSSRPTALHSRAPAASPSAAAPAPAPASKPAKPEGRLKILDLLKATWRAITFNFWSMAFIFTTCDTLQFALHRVSHRATNEVAVALLSGNGITADAIGNMWWLTTDPNIQNLATGYQAVSIGFFLLMFPINLVIRSMAFASAVLVSEGNPAPPPPPPASPAPAAAEGGEGVVEAAAATVDPSSADTSAAAAEAAAPEKKKKVWFGSIRGGLGRVFQSRGEVASMWKRVAWVECLVSLRAIPLQLLSLLVVTLPYTLPRLADLQLATAVAVMEPEKEGKAALERAKALSAGERKAVLAPVVISLVASKLLEFANAYAFLNVSYFLERGVGELFFVLFLAFNLLNFMILRARDLAPYVALKELKGWVGAATSY